MAELFWLNDTQWAALDVLLGIPEIARERAEITPPVRIHRHRSHIMVSRIEQPNLAVIRSRHGHEDWIEDIVVFVTNSRRPQIADNHLAPVAGANGTSVYRRR